MKKLSRRHIVLALIALPLIGAITINEINANEQTLKKVTVDGIDCIIYDGWNAGGISCNWEH